MEMFYIRAVGYNDTGFMLFASDIEDAVDDLKLTNAAMSERDWPEAYEIYAIPPAWGNYLIVLSELDPKGAYFEVFNDVEGYAQINRFDEIQAWTSVDAIRVVR